MPMKNNNRPESEVKVVLVTGASSGIGKATALYFQERDWMVFGLSRSGRVPEGVQAVLADVAKPEEVRTAVQEVMNRAQRLDAVVHAAGIGGSGSLEDFPLEEVRKIMNTNWFGTVHLLQACLPHLRQRSKAAFVAVSSIAGLMGVPFHGVYSASKFAVEALVESARMELSGTGVKVVSVCPGDTATPIIGNQHRAGVEEVQPIYQKNYKRAERAMRESVDKGLPPERVAAIIWQAVNHKRPPVRYIVGDFIQKLAPLAKRWLGAQLFERIMKLYYGLS